MPTEIRIYFEGDKSLKPGFAAFFSELKTRAMAKRCKVEFIATGGKPQGDFTLAMATHQTAWNILIRDSERPYKPNLSAALCAEQGWSQSHADSIFWMVEMMESWFYADKDALAGYYKKGFRKEALKANSRVEEIPKQDLISGLKAATKDTAKRDYFHHKAKHGPDLLALINPVLVRKAAPNCERIFKAVLDRLAES